MQGTIDEDFITGIFQTLFKLIIIVACSIAFYALLMQMVKIGTMDRSFFREKRFQPEYLFASKLKSLLGLHKILLFNMCSGQKLHNYSKQHVLMHGSIST